MHALIKTSRHQCCVLLVCYYVVVSPKTVIMNVQASDLPPSAAILVSWIFSLPQASLNHNFADGEGVVKSRIYQDAL